MSDAQPRIAILGYASLDHVAVLDGHPRPGRTTTILARPEDGWPRLGGSPAYVAAALGADCIEGARPITWIGDDPAGDGYLRQLGRLRVPVQGVCVVAGARTPVAILAYEPDGGCLCLYHPALPKPLSLSDAQKDLIAAADWLCMTVGPPGATAAALDLIGETTRLAWVVKHDPKAMSAELACRLAARADLICFSQAESAFLHGALGSAPGGRPGRILIETHGRAGAAFTRDGTRDFVAATPVAVADPTGAGDTFAGGALAALVKGETDPAAILQAGHDAARRLLESRGVEESDGFGDE